MYDDGHDIGNHSYSHNYLGGGKLDGSDGIDYLLHRSDVIGNLPLLSFWQNSNYPLSEEIIEREIKYTQDAIQYAVWGDGGTGTGIADYTKARVSNYFRTPFTADGRRAPNLINVCRKLNLPIIHGEGTGDYDATSASSVIDLILNEVPAPDKPVITYFWAIHTDHDLRYSPFILEVLDTIVPALKAKGYEFVTLSEMEAARHKALTPGNEYYSLKVQFD